ncbi:MAG: hypothetical protein ACJ75B_17475 [Flavisolibacter sp.]
MYTINTGTEWLILSLVLVNFLAVAAIRSHDRFWIPPVILWLFLFFATVIIWQTNSRIIEYKEAVASNHLNKNYSISEVDENKTESRDADLKLVRLLGVESMIGFVLQGIGYQTTNRNYYKKSLISFLIVAVLYVLAEIFFL